jgi:porin
MVGKANTLDGDPNEFASGRGTTQFMNANFIFNPVLALRLPYSTLAVGVIWLPVQETDRGITVTNLVFNTGDSSTTTGFDDFGEGTSWSIQAEFQYRLGGLPGGQNAGFLYSFDQNFAQFSGEFVFLPGQGLAIPTQDDTWAAYWSLWQYLSVEEPAESLMDLVNGEPDHQGFGIFARAGLADQDTNPVEWSISGGVGGKGIIPGRDRDVFGVGYFHATLQQSRLSGLLGIDESSDGFEAFYNLSVTPASFLTFDVQVADSPPPATDTAILLGVRLLLRF